MLQLIVLFFLIALVECRCIAVDVSSGDTCYLLAQKCKISPENFKTYNPNVECQLLQIGQPVCCGFGGLSEKQNVDGSCYDYVVGAGHTCSTISMYYGITVDNINDWNKLTWGWNGCNFIQTDMKICVSVGNSPKPTPDKNAQCGKTSPGNKYDSECPLRACCSQYGY